GGPKRTAGLEEICAVAGEVSKRAAASVEAFRPDLTACINGAREVHRRTAGLSPPGEMKAQARAYLKALLAAKKAAKPLRRSDDFLDALEHEIWEVNAIATYLVVPAGTRLGTRSRATSGLSGPAE